jgi:hypothetical protein
MYAGARMDKDNTFIEKNNEGAIRTDFNAGLNNWYLLPDLNMDGVTDGADAGLVKPNRIGGSYAPTLYFKRKP